MRLQGYRMLTCGALTSPPCDCQGRSPRCILKATDCERQTLLAVQAHFERQLRWSRKSLFTSIVLGTAAVVAAIVAAKPLERGIFVAAAVIELGPLLCGLMIACRRFQAIIVSIAQDLHGGDIRAGRGRVQSLFGLWPVIRDFRTGTLAFAPARLIGLRKLRSGQYIEFRSAPASGVVVGLGCDAQALCEGITEDSCQAGPSVLKCSSLRPSGGRQPGEVRWFCSASKNLERLGPIQRYE
jgi:hypothetical protein